MKIEKTLVRPMIDLAVTTFHTPVRINQSNRSAQQAQEFHVCHMFLYNYYKHLLPKCCTGRTISWTHLSNAAVGWTLIDKNKGTFLRTRDGKPARLKSGALEWEEVPDEGTSSRAMANFLKHHHVCSMAAPGIDGCGEPCCCGGHASRHITGEACDLHGLYRLGAAIMAAEPGKYADSDEAVDAFLHGHGLYRPMAHLKGKRQELWHVEALPHSVRHTARHGKQFLNHLLRRGK